MKRMFHPSLDSFVDVDDKNVDAYAEAGWLKTQPKHVTIPDGTPKPGEHPGVADVVREVPVLEAPAASTRSRSTSGSRSSGRSAARASGAGTSGTPSSGASSTATGSASGASV